MALNNNLPYRQSHRLPGFDYRQPGAYFITVCTHHREPLFGHIVGGQIQLNAAGRMVKSVWDDIPAHFSDVVLDEYVVMPDHFHGIVVIGDSVGAIHESPGYFAQPQRAIRESPLQMSIAERRNMMIPKIIGRFKMQTAKQINELRATPGIKLWQRNYWERILRDDRECAAVRAYIRNNPSQRPA